MSKTLLAALILLLAFDQTTSHSDNTELYETMGVHFSASDEEITARYNELKSQRKVSYR